MPGYNLQVNRLSRLFEDISQRYVHHNIHTTGYDWNILMASWLYETIVENETQLKEGDLSSQIHKQQSRRKGHFKEEATWKQRLWCKGIFVVAEGTITEEETKDSQHKQGYWSREQCVLPAEEMRGWPDCPAGPQEMLLHPGSGSVSWATFPPSFKFHHEAVQAMTYFSLSPHQKSLSIAALLKEPKSNTVNIFFCDPHISSNDTVKFVKQD